MLSKQHAFYRNEPLSDVSEQQAAQDWLPLEIAQISSGDYQGRIRELGNQDVRVVFEQQNCTVHKRGMMDAKLCTISFVRSSNTSLRFSEYNAFKNALFFLPSNAELDIQVGADVETVYFRFEESSLLESARAINPQRWENTPNSLLLLDAIDRRPLDLFTDYLYENSVLNSTKELPQREKYVASSIMEQVLLTLDSSQVPDTTPTDVIARRRACELVNQAIDYVNSRLEIHICPSIVDICTDLKISQRNLQYCFKKVLDISPNAYLYRLRLNRVRAQLLRPKDSDVTVTEVAFHWHFWHLGRFSSDYVQLFGELPSATLRRALS